MEMNIENTKVIKYGNYKIYEHEFDVGPAKGLIKVVLPGDIPINKINIDIVGGNGINEINETEDD